MIKKQKNALGLPCLKILPFQNIFSYTGCTSKENGFMMLRWKKNLNRILHHLEKRMLKKSIIDICKFIELHLLRYQYTLKIYSIPISFLK